MGMKTLIILVALVILISSCSTEEKTKPIVTDITAQFVREVQEVNESEEEIRANETKEIEEINKSEEEKPLPIRKPGTHVITIEELRLNPQELTIKKGDTVIWNHKDKWEEEEPNL